ncbi:DUF2235 domain-containing protein [Jannaschia sp. W003]|uniref:phospholipase effector Tle1 domain-containing protein n=1 Tax=Jannaschia sp. W003 TaxID=2867012 RepID=UPI0021A3E1F2|nr:DUF2235 domain-containing protein [Jannaschia sp. W003]UWQ21066.1 DUF2235 domain-containing protein [Jannaschia sp. W003]
MKRIVILCDGTWNSPDMTHPTNVVRLARALAPEARDADGTPVAQVPIYLEGVGTGRRGVTRTTRLVDRVLGGTMGMGLLDTVAEAYRHLVFLHEPGDEVFVFGYSRGAFTARSLVGLIRHAGLIERSEMHRLPEVSRRYAARSRDPDEARQAANALRRAETGRRVSVDARDRDRLRALAGGGGPDAARAARALAATRDAVPMRIAFLGVWDTVGALGVPGWFTAAPLLNRRHQFHDTALSELVLSARHAVALDERRRSFAPTLWSNLHIRNGARVGTPYREWWFAGDHGAVGGGGEITALSALALLWLMEGAEAAGLRFAPGACEAIAAEADPFGPLRNSAAPAGGPVAAMMRRFGRDRAGPAVVEGLHPSVRRRWARAGDPPDWPYRPGSLARLRAALDAPEGGG